MYYTIYPECPCLLVAKCADVFKYFFQQQWQEIFSLLLTFYIKRGKMQNQFFYVLETQYAFQTIWLCKLGVAQILVYFQKVMFHLVYHCWNRTQWHILHNKQLKIDKDDVSCSLRNEYTRFYKTTQSLFSICV